MAKKKMSTGQKLLIGAVIVVGGVVIYKMIAPSHSTTTIPTAATPSGQLPGSLPGGNVLTEVKSIFDSISKIFKGSGSTISTTTLPNASDYGMTVGGNRRGIRYR